MRMVSTMLLLSFLCLPLLPARAQGPNDADNIILRLRAVCNFYQGSQLLVVFEIKARGGGGEKRVGGYSDVITYNSSKLVLQSIQARYNQNYWGTFRNFAFGASAWYNQQAHVLSQPGNALPLTNQYWSVSTNCNNAPLNDGFYEVMRYNYQIQPTANGTVNFSLFDVLPYRAGQAYQDGNTISATFYSGLQNNSNDSLIEIKNLTIPIELHAFEATPRADGSVMLSWRTETETSNLGFDIERGDGETFERIGFTPGAGTTNAPTDYQFLDEMPVGRSRDGLVFYRLKQIDVDGTSSYSYIASARLAPPTVGLEQNYPNPSRVGVRTVVPYNLAVPATVHLAVYNSVGERVAMIERDIPREAGRFEAVWDGYSDSGSLASAGVYFIRFNATLQSGETVAQSRQFTLLH